MLNIFALRTKNIYNIFWIIVFVFYFLREDACFDKEMEKQDLSYKNVIKQNIINKGKLFILLG